MTTQRTDRPAEHDVTGRLQPTLARDDAFAVRRVRARPEEPLQDRCLRLLDLEEQRIILVAALEQRREGRQSDASHADDLDGAVDELIPIEQVAAILLERGPIGRQDARLDRRADLWIVVDRRRMVDDPTEAVGPDGGELRQLVERIVVGGATGRWSRDRAAPACRQYAAMAVASTRA